MISLTGPLTERQEEVLEHMAEGTRYQRIASIMGLSLNGVKLEAHAAIRKTGSHTAAQAMGKFLEARAYHNAALQILSGRVPADPDGSIDEVDQHVNHVLEGLAKLFQDWADQRLPK